jgi:hypothetical protein
VASTTVDRTLELRSALSTAVVATWRIDASWVLQSCADVPLICGPAEGVAGSAHFGSFPWCAALCVAADSHIIAQSAPLTGRPANASRRTSAIR